MFDPAQSSRRHARPSSPAGAARTASSAFARAGWWMAALAVVVLIAAQLSPAFAQSDAPNATGGITINGKTTDLPYAYAFAGQSLSSRKPETTLILANKPLSAKSVTDKFARMREARTNGLQRLEFTFDETRTLTSLQFEIEPMGGGGFSTSYKVDVDTFDDTRFKGRAYVEAEQKMFGNVYQFDVRFDAAMTQPRKPDATGAAAWATPPGKALAEFLNAARSGKKAAMKRAIVAERAADLDGPEGARIMSFLKDSADPRTADFDSLIIDGDSAEAKITTRTKEGASSSNMRLRRVDGVWKVSP